MKIISNLRQTMKNRYKRWGILLGVATVLVAFIASALAATCSPVFCTDVCHSMKDVAVSWKKSSHSETPCLSCHVEPGIVALFKDKIKAMPGVWKNALNSYEKPINPESAVAHHIPDEICEQCHSHNRKETPREGLKFSHKAHAKLDATCAECHNRVAHEDKVHKDNMSMEWCFEECHLSKALSQKCTLCHTEDFLEKNKDKPMPKPKVEKTSAASEDH